MQTDFRLDRAGVCSLGFGVKEVGALGVLVLWVGDIR